MKRDSGAVEPCREVQQRVAVLREHDDRFVDAAEQAIERADFRFLPLGGRRTLGDRLKQPPLAPDVSERQAHRPPWRLVFRRHLT